MADTQETIADIIAEMRQMKRYAYVAYRCYQIFADRLEAAIKRERESADAKNADLQSRVKLWTDRSAELVKKCDELYANAHKRELSKICPKTGGDFGQLGDAAKLREALEFCVKGMCGFCRMDAEARGMTTECVNGCEALRKAKAALSTPPRNCDLLEVAKDPWRAWLDDKSNWDEFGSPKLEIHDWLLAPATEKEGGAK